MDTQKYPRTAHLPWSRSKTEDDLVAQEFSFLKPGVEAVVTEKMDGENTTYYRDGYHARSMDSGFHPSRSWVAQQWATLQWQLPTTRRIVLENLYAQHSVRYDALPSYAMGIGVIDLLDEQGQPSEQGVSTFLSWDDTEAVFAELGITPVPVLYRGEVTNELLQELFNSLDFDKHEGIVVRVADAFPEVEFQTHVGKAVRPQHVQTSEHWKRTWVPNKMVSAASR